MSSPAFSSSYAHESLSPTGYASTNERTEELLIRWSQRQSAEGAMSSAEVSELCKAKKTKRISSEILLSKRLLEANKVVEISQDYARQVFGPPPTPTESSGWHVRREVLLHLNQKSALPFRLKDVITGFPASVHAIEDE